jgi:hypothetical protein
MTQQKIIEEKQLENGMTVSIIDNSKPIAGDRFVVRIKCQAKIPVTASLREKSLQKLKESKPEIINSMEKQLCFELLKERNFIGETELIQVKEEAIDQIKTNILDYINNPGFPEKLFLKEYGKKEEEAAIIIPPGNEETEEEDGPADFSHLFSSPGN